MTEAPIAIWLRATRLRQAMPSGDPWSQDYLLERMTQEIGWAPYRPNYSKYEQGKATPKRETLAKFVAFWAGRGEPGPDLSPKVVEPAADPLVAALTAQTKALADLVDELRQWRTQDRVKIGQVEAVVDRLVASALAAPGSRGPSTPAAPAGTKG